MSIWCSTAGPDILALDGATEAAHDRAEGDPVWVVDVATAGGIHDHIRLAVHDVNWERGVVVEALLSPEGARMLRDRLDATLNIGSKTAHQDPTVKPTAARNPSLPALPPRFQWKLSDGNEQRWSGEHTLEGPCPACCCNGPKACSECGGREHSEPVEGMTADGWEAVDALMCQEQREDGIGDPAETRDLPGTP